MSKPPTKRFKQRRDCLLPKKQQAANALKIKLIINIHIIRLFISSVNRIGRGNQRKNLLDI